MATVSGELFHAVDAYDWVGFYRVVAPDLLKIGPYQGGHLLGVLDIDSNQPNFFTWQDADQLDQMLRQLFQNASL